MQTQAKWQNGDKVVITATCITNDQWAVGLVGTVDFEYDTLVYVHVARPGKRKVQNVTVHRDQLTAAQ